MVLHTQFKAVKLFIEVVIRTKVAAKAMTQKALIFGVPFFVATLVKNAKMVPVMLGAIVLGGKSYPLRKYLQV